MKFLLGNGKVRIGINGFGCFGCLVVRVVFERDDIEFVVVNDLFISIDYMVVFIVYCCLIFIIWNLCCFYILCVVVVVDYVFVNMNFVINECRCICLYMILCMDRSVKLIFMFKMCICFFLLVKRLLFMDRSKLVL